MSDIKQAIRREYLTCAQDNAYFLRKYCTIQHPIDGKIKFNLYDFQEDLLTTFAEHSYNIILKSRQLGISTLIAGYCLHMMLFSGDKNILVIAKDKETAKGMITKVRVMFHNLPSWLKVKCEEDNKFSFELSNGSRIQALASTSSAGRSYALSLLVLDEAAFIENMTELWTASQQTLATGGDCIVASTPNGFGSWYHSTWVGAEEGTNDFHSISLHWSMHPDRDQTWRDEQDIKLGPTKAAQEVDADFLSSGTSVVDPKILQWYKDEQVEPPVEKAGIDQNLWIWEYPNYSKEYLITADVARGDGSDFSAMEVFDIEDLKQVAEYKGQLSTTDFGNFLIEQATKYNDALLVIENNNVGWATIQTVINREYKNLFYQNKDIKYVDTDHQSATNKYRTEDKNQIPGFTTSLKTRPLIVAKMEEYTREKLVELRSVRLIEELFVFIYKNNRAEATTGYNDDLVMSYAIALWIRDTALRLKSERDQRQRALMDALLSSNKGYDAGFSKGKTRPKENPWEQDIGGNKESLEWLL